MANRRSFKSDTSFLEKISAGAIGSQQVFENLRNQGHQPIELERGSMSFKIWRNIKIKRIRVPDLLCVTCGHRVESRAKSNFEISMSHSVSDPERGWDYGLNDNDFVALVVCKQVGNKPIDWLAEKLVQYISVKELRLALRDKNAIYMSPKGVGEGFETRIIWPSAVASSAGFIKAVTKDYIQYHRQTDNRTITMRLQKKGLPMKPLVEVGDEVVPNQVCAAVIPVAKGFPCSPSINYTYYLDRLSSPSLSDRYAAAKALSVFKQPVISRKLLIKVKDPNEHIYVRLEAAASLARYNDEQGWMFIEQCLADEYLQNRLEAVIILAEIPADISRLILSNVLKDNNQHPEIRAGAAWALGELRNKSALSDLIDSFSAVNENIRIEAARSLAKLASDYTPEIMREFPMAAREKRPGIAWALSKSGKFKLKDLLESLVDNDARHWVAYILGTQEQQRYIHEIELLKARDAEVYFAATVLWKIMTSWVYDLEEYG
ncbi:MAG: HEAT repeat domain-containing protein [Candidatus Edwardsbacteria bacterium]